MKKYKVTRMFEVETSTVSIMIEASSVEEASEKADEVFIGEVPQVLMVQEKVEVQDE